MKTALELDEIGQELYNAVKIRRCTCVRQFLYHGAVVGDPCNRCRVMILWEERNGEKSETRRIYECTFI